MTGAELCRHIVSEFDVDLATCRTDVSGFLDDLIAAGVVQQA